MLDRLTDALDQAVLFFAPRAGLRRMAFRRLSRLGQAQMSRYDADDADRHGGRAYEGAQAGGRLRGDRWMSSRLSADTALELDRENLVDHSRELYRSDTTGGAVDQRVNHVAHRPFMPQSLIRPVPELPNVPQFTEQQAKQWNQQLEWLFERIQQGIDRTRKRSVWQALRLAERHNAFDGESFTILSDVGTTVRPIPLTLEVIDPMRVETPPEHAANPLVRMGIEYDAAGEIVAYHVRRAHPYDWKELSRDALTYDRLAASRVLHVFEEWFAEQSRGLPWMTRTLNKQKDVKDLDESEIIAAQVQACNAIIVKTANGAHRNAIGAGNGVSSGGNRLQDIYPGAINYLDTDGDIVPFATNRPGNTYEPFQKMNYRGIAAGMDWPYEVLRGDWTGTSFAGGRLALTAGRLSTSARQRLMKEMWLRCLWCRMVEEAVITGADGLVTIPADLYDRAPWLFQVHDWLAPPWPYALNPGEEVKADAEEVNNNFSTKAEKIAARGGDLQEVMLQRRLEVQLERDYGIAPAPKAGAAAPPKPMGAAEGDEDETEDADEMQAVLS